LVFATDASTLSLLYYLRTFAATGGFRPPGPDLPGGGREHRFVGGTQQLAVTLATRLPPGSLRLSTVVRAVRCGPAGADDGVRVVVEGTETLRARRVVLAIPPAVLRDVDVELPAAEQLLVSESRMGHVV